jgi:hypothetical protein
MLALSVQKRSQRGENHAWRAFLTCRLGLELFARPHNETIIRISSLSVMSGRQLPAKGNNWLKMSHNSSKFS